jgi:hypothetical protein
MFLILNRFEILGYLALLLYTRIHYIIHHNDEKEGNFIRTKALNTRNISNSQLFLVFEIIIFNFIEIHMKLRIS